MGGEAEFDILILTQMMFRGLELVTLGLGEEATRLASVGLRRISMVGPLCARFFFPVHCTAGATYLDCLNSQGILGLICML